MTLAATQTPLLVAQDQNSAPLTVAIGFAGLLLELFSRSASIVPEGLRWLPAGINFVNKRANQEVVFGIFAVALLLTAWLAVNMLRGIDEAIYNETT